MADFDWYGTCAAIHKAAAANDPKKAGAVTGVMASSLDGTFLSSYPLAEDGNYAFYTHADAYKATVTKEDMSEAEEDLYESYNLGLLAQDSRAHIAPGHGIRINGVKYNWMRELTNQKHKAKVEVSEGVVEEKSVTIDKVHVCKGGGEGLVVCIKSGYVISAKWTPPQGSAQGGQLETLDAVAVGFYWACGEDPAE